MYDMVVLGPTFSRIRGKHMKNVLIAGLLAVGLVGCADVCAKSEECAKKSGTSFSITQCRTDVTSERERAQTKGCSAEFSALEGCIAGLTCDQLNSATGLTTNCGAQLEKARQVGDDSVHRDSHPA